MAGTLQPILSYAKGMGWRGRILTALGFGLATEIFYEVYQHVLKQIGKRKAQKPFCEVRFMNRAIVSGCSPSLVDAKLANISYLISYIDRAQQSISLSMYILTLNDVCDAIIRARNERNVIVRVVCCESMVYNEGSQMRRLDEECFVRFKANSDYLMHHKFCLLDVDWLCAKCLVAEHIQQVGPPTSQQLQQTLFDRAILDDMEGLEKSFGSSCMRCDPTIRKSVSSSVSNPLPEGGCLIVGSSNWTMPALTVHWDNMMFTSFPAMVRPYAVEFQRQWYELSDNEKKSK
uniref:Mitochondrial cardiolipin hydrolase n=1 Tax=Anopheles atroparvus TaxID=41427 RepID=A0A182J3N4_ANOAO